MDSAEKCRLNIAENRQLVLGCIKSEIAQGKGVYEAFRSLSNVLGEDTISYKEFDILFHRFYHGQFDLDYDMRLETSKPELTDLPPEILVKSILNQLAWKDRISLRQVSKAFRALIDGLKCKVYNKVVLYIHHIEDVELIIDDQYFYFSTDDFKPHYGSPKDLEPIKCFGGFKEAFALLFRLLSATGVKTKQFNVEIVRVNDYEIVTTVRNTVKSSENLMAVRNFMIESSIEDQMVVFLSSMEPGILEEIDILPQFGSTAEEVIYTEQWEQARALKWFGMKCPLSSFLHFNRFTVYIQGLSDIDLLDIKDACFDSPDFEFCHLFYDVDVDSVAAVLGPKKVFKPDTGKIFSVEYDEDGVIFEHNNHFDFVGLTINGDESAVLKLDGESIEYENGLEMNDGNRRPGNWKDAVDHLADVWRIPKVEIDELQVEFHSLGAKASEIQEAVKTFFKSFRYKIPVTSLHMKIDSEDQLEVVLPHLEPWTLGTIKIDGNGSIGEDEEGKPEYLRIENGLESAQLMKARSLHVTSIELPYDALLQYFECTGFFHEINEEQIVQIKNDFLAKTQLNCSLTLHFRDAIDEEKMKSLLGPSEIEVPDNYSPGTFTIEYEASCIRFKKTWRHSQGGMGRRLMVWEMDGSDESDGHVDGSDSDEDQSEDSYQSDESDASFQSEESESSDL